MKRSKPPTEEHIAESQRLHAIWKEKTTLSQTQFGKQYALGIQSYVHQCLTGKTILTLKAGIAFARHLNCHLSEFSPRLDDELAKLVDFDNEQKALLVTNKLFSKRGAP